MCLFSCSLADVNASVTFCFVWFCKVSMDLLEISQSEMYWFDCASVIRKPETMYSKVVEYITRVNSYELPRFFSRSALWYARHKRKAQHTHTHQKKRDKWRRNKVSAPLPNSCYICCIHIKMNVQFTWNRQIHKDPFKIYMLTEFPWLFKPTTQHTNTKNMLILILITHLQCLFETKS